jgi:hypothetical protein
MSGPQSGEDVDVVSHPTHRVRDNVHSTDDPSEVIMNMGRCEGGNYGLRFFVLKTMW